MLEGGPAGQKEKARWPHYTSLILRCWIDDQGRVTCRLIEVGSGISHPLTDLAALPGLVKRLVSKWDPLPRGPADRVQGEG